MLLLIVLAGIPSGTAAADGSASGKGGASFPVEVDGRTIQIAAPTGLSYAQELLPMYAGIGRSMNAEVRAVFWPESQLLAVRAGRRPDILTVSCACVAVFKGEGSLPPERAREFFAYEWMQGEQILRSHSTSADEYALVQSVLHSDPEGRMDIPLPVKPGSRVGLALHHLEDRAGIELQLSPSRGQSAGDPVVASSLRAMATVIVREQVIGMFLIRYLEPTTRAVEDLNRDSQAWVKETIAMNEDKPLGEPEKKPSSAGSSWSYPKFGELVHVEKLPEVVRRVPPEYPNAARKAGVSGKVMVQALIGRDGLVKDTRVVESIPPLDRAAVAAVRQWEFKPAQGDGRSVAVWVGIPVSFKLH